MFPATIYDSLLILTISNNYTGITLNNCTSNIRTNDIVLVVDGTNKLCAGFRRHLPLTKDPSLHVAIEVSELSTIHLCTRRATIILYTNTEQQQSITMQRFTKINVFI